MTLLSLPFFFFSPFIYLSIFIIILAMIYLHKIYGYWRIRGVNGPKPYWILGNILPRLILSESLAEYDANMYMNFCDKGYCGYYEFTRPVLMLRSLDLLKSVLIKEFDHFTDRCIVMFNEPVMDNMLLGLKGSIWKKVRSAMTPTFTSGKIKQTFPLVKDCAENLVKYFNAQLGKGNFSFEMKEVYGMLTMDTIASIAFGVSSDSLNDKEDEFSAAAARFFKPQSRWESIFTFLRYIPFLAKYLKINERENNPVTFFSHVVSDTIKFRLENGIHRNDFLQLLLDASFQEYNTNASNACKAFSDEIKDTRVLTEIVIIAQCVLFYIAGYDTTATTLSFVSYCLALHPQVQYKLLEEIDMAIEKNGYQINFEVLQSMTYLDMVFMETLRLFPAAPRVDRRCTKKCTLPGLNFSISEGTKVVIPIYSIHRDPELYHNPEQFDPERFSEHGKFSHAHMSFLPFGDGPRNCIGKRFALMEAKLALVRVLCEFAFFPCKKTQVPIQLDRSSGLLKAKDGIWVRMTKRTV